MQRPEICSVLSKKRQNGRGTIFVSPSSIVLYQVVIDAHLKQSFAATCMPGSLEDFKKVDDTKLSCIHSTTKYALAGRLSLAVSILPTRARRMKQRK
jgi:hypothetical protein